MAFDQEAHHGKIDDRGDRGGKQHRAAVDRLRVQQSTDRQDGDRPGNEEQHHAIDQGCEDAGPLEAERSAGSGWPGREHLGTQHQEDGHGVGEVVAGISQESGGVG